jgi:hypothetical protein
LFARVFFYSWHANALQNELKDCPIKTLNLDDFEAMKESLDMDTNLLIYNLLKLSNIEIARIENIRDTP